MAAKTETRRLGENFILRNIRINWADHLFEVDDGDYGNGKYGCDILIDKSDTETVKKITDFTINLIKQACEKQPNGRPLLDTSRDHGRQGARLPRLLLAAEGRRRLPRLPREEGPG